MILVGEQHDIHHTLDIITKSYVFGKMLNIELLNHYLNVGREISYLAISDILKKVIETTRISLVLMIPALVISNLRY